MWHLTDKQINQMVHFVLNKKYLTDELMEAKKHMASCEECYEKFCISLVVAHELLKAGLIEEDALLYSEVEEVEESIVASKENIFLRLNGITGKIQQCVADDLWRFLPISKLAFSRGDNNKKEQIFTNSIISEYTSIRVNEEAIIITLDDEYYKDGLYEVVFIADGTEKIYQFEHNELDECLEVKIKLESEKYQLEIRGIV